MSPKPDDEDEQEHSGEERGQAGAGTGGLHVDHGLADHRAATHAAEEPGDDVRGTLAPRLAGLVRVGVGDVVDQLGGQQGLQQPDERHRDGVGGDDLERVQGERDVGEEQRREAVGQLALVADVRHVDRRQERERGEDDDGDQRRGDHLRDARQADHDGDADGDHRVDQPRHVDHVRDLRQEDQDRQGVDESDHDLAGDEAHQSCHADEAEDDLQDTGEDDGGDEVVQAVVLRHGCDDQGDGAGGGGDHGGAAAEEGDGDRHGEGREEADAGVDPGDDGERDGLGDERERDHEAGEDLGAQHGRGSQRVAYGRLRRPGRAGGCRQDGMLRSGGRSGRNPTLT